MAILVVAGALSGCESTVDRAKKADQQGSKAFERKGLEIGAANRDAEVTGTTVLHDANGAAVVIAVRNRGARLLTDVPIAIDVLDAKGAVVYRNDTPGLQASQRSIALLPPGKEVLWVNDQVVSTGGEPAKVRAKLGAAPASAKRSIADLDLSGVDLAGDAVSGLAASGVITNATGAEQRSVTISAVAEKAGRIVAAGRAIVPLLKPGAHTKFQTFFIGDPRGADLTLTAPPTTIP